VSGTLVIQTAFLGDVVLTMPLLTAVAERHGPIDIVVTPQAAPLLEGHPAVRRVLPYDKRGADRGIGAFFRLAGVLRRSAYDRAYLPHGSMRTAGLALLAGVPERIGFGDSPAARTYTLRVPRPRDTHETRRLLALAGAGWETADVRFDLPTSETDRRRAAAWLAERGVDDGFVAVAPGSVWGTKRWPFYPELARLLPDRIVVIGGPEDRERGEAIAAAAGGRAVSAAGALSLRESAALLRHAGILVTNDSAPLHLAAAVGVPTVAVFGPTVPAFGFGPVGAEDVIVEVTGLSCRPCSRHGPAVCPLGHHRCMRDLTVERVAAAVAERRRTGIE